MKIRMVLFLGFLTMATALPAKGVSLDSLMNRIEARFEMVADYDTFSASVVSVTKKMDGKWKPKEEYTIEKKIMVVGKEEEEKIIKAIKKKKGKEIDITEKIKEKQRKAKKKAEKREMRGDEEDQDEHEEGKTVQI